MDGIENSKSNYYKKVKKAKVCATLKKKMAYCSEKWTHIKLARQYMREYEYMQP